MAHDMSLPRGDRDEHLEDDQYTIPDIKKPEPINAELLEESGIISQRAIWKNADLHGWHNPPAPLEVDLLLIHSEISEACEALRAGNLYYENGKDSVEEELADAVIRIFHTAEKNGLDICEAVRRKHNKNMSRPYRHGNKAF